MPLGTSKKKSVYKMSKKLEFSRLEGFGEKKKKKFHFSRPDGENNENNNNRTYIIEAI